MHLVYILKGLPGSGKSTFATSLIESEPSRWIRVNRDNLRAMYHPPIFTKLKETYIINIQTHIITQALKNGFDCIVDDTNITDHSLRRIHKICASIGDIRVIEKAFNIDIEEAKRRNSLRNDRDRVPDKTIDRMAKQAGLDCGNILLDAEIYYGPIVYTKYIPNYNLPKAIICDIDGTIADNTATRSPYDTAKCLDDAPIAEVIELVRMFYDKGYLIIFCTGRDEKYEKLTREWLDAYVGIKYELYMRPIDDTTKDVIVKGNIFEQHIRNKYYIGAVIEDRLQMCQLWYQLGLPLFRVGDPDAVY